jgi:hypothetical protein
MYQNPGYLFSTQQSAPSWDGGGGYASAPMGVMDAGGSGGYGQNDLLTQLLQQYGQNQNQNSGQPWWMPRISGNFNFGKGTNGSGGGASFNSGGGYRPQMPGGGGGGLNLQSGAGSGGLSMQQILGILSMLKLSPNTQTQ